MRTFEDSRIQSLGSSQAVDQVRLELHALVVSTSLILMLLDSVYMSSSSNLPAEEQVALVVAAAVISSPFRSFAVNLLWMVADG